MRNSNRIIEIGGVSRVVVLGIVTGIGGRGLVTKSITLNVLPAYITWVPNPFYTVRRLADQLISE